MEIRSESIVCGMCFCVRRTSKIVLCAFALCVAILVGLPAYAADAAASSEEKIHIMTLMGSDAIIIESNGMFGMVDSGEDDDYPDGSDPRYPLRPGVTQGHGYQDEVIDYMRSIGVTSDNFEFYIGTHPHSDHIGSADEVIRAFCPKRVYVPEYRDEYITYDPALWDNQYVYDRMLEAAYEVGSAVILGFDPSAPVVPSEPDPIASETDHPDVSDTSSEGESPSAGSLASRATIAAEDGPEPQHDPFSPSEAAGLDFKRDDFASLQDEGASCPVGNPSFMLGDFSIDIMNYDDGYKTEHVGDANCFSLGVKVSAYGKTAFLAGDIGTYDGDEERLAVQLGHVDLLKMGHHGLGTSNSPSYLFSLSPCYAMWTSDYGTLPNDRFAALDQIGTRIWNSQSSSEKGFKAVVFSFSNEGIGVDGPEDVVVESRSESSEKIAYRNGEKVILNGWVADGDRWLWFGGSFRATQSSWIPYNGDWYYVGNDAFMVTGWLYDNGSWYWLDSYDGRMATGWIHDGTNWYYMDGSGRMQSGGWFLIDGAWYWLAANGAMATGWLNDGGAWYWLDPVSGRMATGTAVIDGRTYFFDDSGRMIEHKWDAGRVVKEPNGDIPGEKLFTCTLCGQTKTDPFRNATVERIAGNYANQTAAAISSKAFDSSEWVVVARDDDFADAMSATGLAGALECPIVLTGHQGLSAAAAAEIERLGATRAYIIGGTGALPANLENEIAELGRMVEKRLFGEYSWDTSVVCADEIKLVAGSAYTGDSIVAMSSNFQDALSISSFAYKYKVPIFLQTQWENRSLPQEAIERIGAADGAIYVPGGPGAVTEASVEGVFGEDRVVRIYGEDGYDTSNQIAHYMVDNGFLKPDVVVVACGAQGAKGSDALAGAALAGRSGGVILLVNGNTALESQHFETIEGRDSVQRVGFVADYRYTVDRCYMLGGSYVMPDAVLSKTADIIFGTIQ